MFPAGHLGHIIIHAEPKTHPAVGHFQNLAIALHHHPDGRRRGVGQLQTGAYGGHAQLQFGRDGLPAGLFHQRRHGGGRQHRQLAAAHRPGGVLGGHPQRCMPFASNLYHGILL